MSKSTEALVRPAQAVVQGAGEWARVRLSAQGVSIEAGGKRTEIPLAELIERFAREHPEVPVSRPDA